MKQYHDLLEKILTRGTDKTDRTGTGTRSIFGPQMRFDLADGFPLLTTKKLHLKSIIHELLWLLSGETNIKYLVDTGVNIWTEWPLKAYNQVHQRNPLTLVEFTERMRENKRHFAVLWGDLGPVYGKQWRRTSTHGPGTIDQMQQMIDLLRTTPDSRRMVVDSWNVVDLPQMALSPCHCLFQFYTVPLTYTQRCQLLKKQESESSWKAFCAYIHRSQCELALDNLKVPQFRLDCQLYQRSADVFLGVPFNIASYALLTMMMAQVVNMVPGEFIWTGGDTHLYNNHFEQAQRQLQRAPRPLPTMTLNPAVTDLFGFKFEDFTLEKYNPHPSIKASVSV